MKLEEIMCEFGHLGIREERCRTDDYGELVFYNREIDEWTKIFADILGPAMKPAGVEPTEEHLSLARDHGGVWAEQTLFKREFGDATVIAMFWPWQDDRHTTLKIALVRK